MSRLESSWREQAMPKREVSGIVDAPFRHSVKYENSSVDLKSDKLDGPAQIGSPRHGFAPKETKKGRGRNLCQRQGYLTNELHQIGP